MRTTGTAVGAGRRRSDRGQGGFTLIELLVVVAILAILAGIAVLATGGLVSDSELQACKVEKRTARTAAQASDVSAATDTWLTFMDGTPKYVADVTGSGASVAITMASGSPSGC